MDFGLNGRVALVLGASSGLSLASAEALAGEGAAVVMVACGEELLQRHAGRLGAHALIGDLSKPGDLEHAVSTTVSEYGGLDIVVTNGGGPPPGSALSAADDSNRPSRRSSSQARGRSRKRGAAASAKEWTRPDRVHLVGIGPRADPKSRPFECCSTRGLGVSEVPGRRGRARRAA